MCGLGLCTQVELVPSGAGAELHARRGIRYLVFVLVELFFDSRDVTSANR